jgi:hypothetical protein
MLNLTGYIVRKTDAAVAFVRESDAGVTGVRPIWIPVKKLGRVREADAMGRRIVTAQDGERVGIPATVEVDSAFLDRIGVLA